MNYPSVLGGLSTHDVGLTSRQIPSNPWDHNLLAMGSRPLTHLMKNSGIWSPATSVIRRNPNTTHGSAYEHVAGQGTAVGAVVGDYIGGNYKTYFVIAHKNSILQSELENIELIRPPLDSTSVDARLFQPLLDLTPVGTKTSDAKTSATDSLSRKEKAQKYYVPEDPD